MSRLAVPAAAALLFAAFLVWLLPVDALVRRWLARATPAGGPTVVFERATLGLDGIHLEDVSVLAPTGAEIAHADAAVLRPSVVGLVRDGSGLPWHLATDACAGRLTADIAADGPALTVALTWDDADLAACPFLPLAAGALAGRARGVARVRVQPTAWPEGEGRVDLEHGQWQAAGALEGLGALRAEAASVRWTLRDGRLVLDALDLRGPDVSARGSGAVDLVDPLPDSPVQLTLALATAPEAQGLIRLLLGPPGSDRQMRVGGTLARPSALLQ